MISEFGGDIFDDDPPAAVPPKKGGAKEHKPSVQKVNLKARARRDADDLGFAAPAGATSKPEATADLPAEKDDDAESERGRGDRGRRRRSTRRPPAEAELESGDEGRVHAEAPAESETEREDASAARAAEADAPPARDRRRGGRGGRRPKAEPSVPPAMRVDALAADAGGESEEPAFLAAEEPDIDDDIDLQPLVAEDEEDVEEEIEEEIVEETFEDAESDTESATEIPVALDEEDDEEELFEPSATEARAPTEERGPGTGRKRRRRRGRDRDRDRDRERDRGREFEPGAERGREERGPLPPPPPRAVPPGERTPRPDRGAAWAPSAPTGARAAPATQRVALFVDVEALQREARTLGGQISFSRVLRQVAGVRTLSRAVAYCGAHNRNTGGVAGLETVRVERETETPVAVAVDALATAPRVDCVVIAPEALATGPLVRALRAAGVRVESAGFEARGPSEVADHQRLGKEALFAP